MQEENKERVELNPQTDHVVVTVQLEDETKQLQWNKQLPLLDALLIAGIKAPHSCCRGNCGTCIVKLLAGEVRLRRNFILSAAHLEQGLILTCVAAPVSDSIAISYI